MCDVATTSDRERRQSRRGRRHHAWRAAPYAGRCCHGRPRRVGGVPRAHAVQRCRPRTAEKCVAARTAGAAADTARRTQPARAGGLTVCDLFRHCVVDASDGLRGPHLVVACGHCSGFGALAGHCRSSRCDSVSGGPKHGWQFQRDAVGRTSRLGGSGGLLRRGSAICKCRPAQHRGMLMRRLTSRVAFGRLCQRAPAPCFWLSQGGGATAGAVGADAAECAQG